jgi:hypothetical protein
MADECDPIRSTLQDLEVQLKNTDKLLPGPAGQGVSQRIIKQISRRNQRAFKVFGYTPRYASSVDRAVNVIEAGCGQGGTR